MNLSDKDLKQIDEEYLSGLSREELEKLSKKLLDDLRVSRDRLNMNAENSSCPSGSLPHWWKAESIDGGEESGDESEESCKSPNTEVEVNSGKESSGKRKSGKQEGAEGHGRREDIEVTETKYHKASECAGCGCEFDEDTGFTATIGRNVLDVEREILSLTVTYVKHIYGKSECVCGHITETEPGRCEEEEGWSVGLTEYHLVGPMLCSLLICLSLRMRLSRSRIQEFLVDWLGVHLSVGCINQCITEGGRAMAPLEEELLEAIEESELLHADETGWKENGKTVWLWVLRTATVTFYIIGSRSWEVIATALENFAGWLMSDGYTQYRKYGKRLRCLAHIIRKARGLSESTDPEAAAFGETVLDFLQFVVKAIYRARGDPSIDLQQQFAQRLDTLKKLCELYRDHPHEKTRQLARELLNDWDAIWNVLAFPHLPITNNLAERTLRHWVISRKISYGTRTQQGSKAFTLLASVIDTCRQRGISPWPYIAQVIALRRKGLNPPPLPS